VSQPFEECFVYEPGWGGSLFSGEAILLNVRDGQEGSGRAFYIYGSQGEKDREIAHEKLHVLAKML
jgi:hypothetical protein